MPALLAALIAAPQALAAPADLDPTFSGDGKQVLDGGNRLIGAVASEAVVDSSGRLVVAGRAYTEGVSEQPDTYLARYTASGALDPSFSSDGIQVVEGGFNPNITGIAIDTQGRIVTLDWRGGLDRYSASGERDPSWGTTALNAGPEPLYVDLVLDGDAPLIAAVDSAGFSGPADEMVVVRATAATGAPDPSFGGGDGVATVALPGAQVARALGVDSSGRIFIAGSDGASGGDIVVRLSSSGAIAPAGFGGGDGVAPVPAGFPITEISVPTAAGAHADKPVFAGLTANGQRIAAARLNADGSPDTGFGGDGVAELPLPAGYGSAIAVDLRATSAGSVTVAGGLFQNSSGAYDPTTVRFTSSGTPDGSYGGGDGFETAAFGPPKTQSLLGAAFTASGSAVVVGGLADVVSRQDIASFGAGGTLDNSFDGDGKLSGPIAVDSVDRIRVVVRDGSGYVAAGFSDARDDGDPAVRLFVARYTATGELDTSFDGDGKAFAGYGTQGFKATDLAIDGAGRIIVVGTESRETSIVAARLLASGAPDPGFGGQGADPPGFNLVREGSGAEPAPLPSVAVDSQNRVVIGRGNDDSLIGGVSHYELYRLTTSGALDGSFDGDGVVTTDLGGFTEHVSDVAIAAGDRILAVGPTVPDNRGFAILRYTTGGALDPGFGGGDGYDIRATTNEETLLQRPSLVQDGAGKITIAGRAFDGIRLTRYLSNGTVDPAFAPGKGGIATYQHRVGEFLAPMSVGGVELDPLGRPIVAGGITLPNAQGGAGSSDLYVARFQLDGDISRTFDPGDGVRVLDMGGNEAAESINRTGTGLAVGPDGKIVVAGTSEIPDSGVDGVLARLVGGSDPDPSRTLTVTTAGNAGSQGVVTGPGISCQHDGGTSGDCTEVVEDGTRLILTATPTGTTTFSGWSGACSGTDLTCTVDVDANKTVTAHFERPPTPDPVLTIAGAPGGTVTGPGIDCGADCTETYSPGATVTLTATPASGNNFLGWGGSCIEQSGPTCVLVMDRDRFVNVSFAIGGGSSGGGGGGGTDGGGDDELDGGGDDTACAEAKAKLATAKAKLKKLKEQGAPREKIQKAKAKVRRWKEAVDSAC